MRNLLIPLNAVNNFVRYDFVLFPVMCEINRYVFG